MNISQSFSQKQVQKLKQILSPKMIQMLGTFSLSYSSLVEKITQESQENVFIEVNKSNEMPHFSQGTSSASFMSQDIADFAEDKTALTVDLYAFVIKQIDLLALSPRDKDILMHLCEHLDDRGYIQNYPEHRQALATQFGVQERKINGILEVLHSLDPDGIGARDLKECLLLQIRHHDFASEQLRTVLDSLIKYHLDDLSKQKYKHIAECLNIEEEGVESLSRFIKNNLNPNPGIDFSSTPFNQHIIPSFEVHMDGATLTLSNLEEKHGITMSISKKYLHILEDPGTDTETKTFLKAKFETAKTLQENLKKRIDTLNKLSQYVCHKQIGFIQHGPRFLDPLLQKDIALALDITPSTVSRIVSSKYIITPHGTYSLKQLCPRSHFGKTSERLKGIVQELANQFPSYSDEKLKKVLHQEHNIPLARRTVAKYRNMTETRSSYDRKTSRPNSSQNIEG